MNCKKATTGTVKKTKAVKRLDKKCTRQGNTLDSWVKESENVMRTRGDKSETVGQLQRHFEKGATGTKPKSNVLGQVKSNVGAKSFVKGVSSAKTPKNTLKTGISKTELSSAKRQDSEGKMGTISTVNTKKLQKEIDLGKKMKIWDSYFLKNEKGGKMKNEEGEGVMKKCVEIKNKPSQKCSEILKGVVFAEAEKGKKITTTTKSFPMRSAAKS